MSARPLEHVGRRCSRESTGESSIAGPSNLKISKTIDENDMKNGESLSALRRMVLGEMDMEFSDDMKQ